MNLVEQLMTLVSQQLAWQFDTYTSLETKAIGLLAFDGALGAFVAILHPMPELLRILFFVALVVSVGSCLSSLWIRKVYTGPNVSAFYQWTQDWTNEEEIGLALVVNLESDIYRNHAPLAKKGLYWMIAAIAIVLAVIVDGVDFAFF